MDADASRTAAGAFALLTRTAAADWPRAADGTKHETRQQSLNACMRGAPASAARLRVSGRGRHGRWENVDAQARAIPRHTTRAVAERMARGAGSQERRRPSIVLGEAAPPELPH
jgi:hypothetical protein